MIDVASVAPLNGWRQAGAPHWKTLETHVFSATSDGQLAHYTEGTLRAVVPPEGWEAFCALWPDAQAIVDQLRRPAQPPADPAATEGAGEGEAPGVAPVAPA